MKSVIIYTEAEADIEASVNYYKEQNQGLEKLFLNEIYHALKCIQKNPEIYPRVKHNFRKIFLRKFPFLILYEILPNEIIILAVEHQRRGPKYWMKRMRK